MEGSAAMAGVRPLAPRGAPNVSFHVPCGPAGWAKWACPHGGEGIPQGSHEGANAVLEKLTSAMQYTPLSAGFITTHEGLGHSNDCISVAMYCTELCRAFRIPLPPAEC